MAAGAQRTGGVIACYRLLVEKKDISFVLEEMMRYGWSPKRNVLLLPYLNSHMAELAALLQKMGVIDHVPVPLPRLEIDKPTATSGLFPRRQPENNKTTERQKVTKIHLSRSGDWMVWIT